MPVHSWAALSLADRRLRVKRGLKRLRAKYAGRQLSARPASIDVQRWEIFTCYFYEGLSLSGIGVRAGVSRSRVSRILYEVDARLDAAGQIGPEKQSIAFESPIEELGLSSRAQNAIHRLECATVKDLLRLDLSAVRGIGRKTRCEVSAALRSCGLPLPEVDEHMESELRGLDGSLGRMQSRIKAALDALAREIALVQKRLRKRMEAQIALPSRADSPRSDHQPVS
jgi:Bacterial RNA polymerase, alpha chain C terminal domain/Sigma-70, region 4